LLIFTSALAGQAMQTASIARGGMSICLSVTLWYCIKTKKARHIAFYMLDAM